MANADMTQALGGRTPVRIYLLDNSFKTMLLDGSETAESLCTQMAEKLGFADPAESAYYFALYEARDGARLDRSLTNDESPLSVSETWPNPDAKFVFQVKLHMTALSESSDPKVRHMLFLQAVYNVIVGNYPCSGETAAQLAALQLQVKFGTHNPETHRPGFLGNRIVEYIPNLLMPDKRPDQWEEDIYREHALLTTVEDPRANYLAIVSEFDSYGCAFFPAKQYQTKKYPTDLFLGITSNGIHLLNTEKAQMQLFKLSEIYRWGFKPNVIFYFEIKKYGGSGPMHEFVTQEGNRISELLTDYAMAFLKEMGLGDNAGASSSGAASGAAGGDDDAAPPATPAGQEISEPTQVEHQMATRIQSRFRGYSLRRDLEFEYAAIRVQSVFRGYRQRKAFDELISKMEAELLEAEGLEEGDLEGEGLGEEEES